MNKISIYILLVLLFLGLSTSFLPAGKGTKYIINEKVYSNFFKGSPISVVLLDCFKTGLLIKTYFHKYKVIHAFKEPETMTIRTSRDFWEKNIKNIGMSLYRKKDEDSAANTTPMPPGTIYIGDLAFGTWQYSDASTEEWFFHRAYRHFPKLFSWGNWRPSLKFYLDLKVHLKNNAPFYGLNQEFGIKGSITNRNILHSLNKSSRDKFSLLTHLKKFITIQAQDS